MMTVLPLCLVALFATSALGGYILPAQGYNCFTKCANYTTRGMGNDGVVRCCKNQDKISMMSSKSSDGESQVKCWCESNIAQPPVTHKVIAQPPVTDNDVSQLVDDLRHPDFFSHLIHDAPSTDSRPSLYNCYDKCDPKFTSTVTVNNQVRCCIRGDSVSVSSSVKNGKKFKSCTCRKNSVQDVKHINFGNFVDHFDDDQDTPSTESRPRYYNCYDKCDPKITSPVTVNNQVRCCSRGDSVSVSSSVKNGKKFESCRCRENPV